MSLDRIYVGLKGVTISQLLGQACVHTMTLHGGFGIAVDRGPGLGGTLPTESKTAGTSRKDGERQPDVAELS